MGNDDMQQTTTEHNTVCKHKYRKVSNRRRANYQNLNASRLIL